ncbi:MAG: 50S ribosomal protein L21 [Deltaproteobacteria bacterium RIFCSPLOWO2_12_FULL_40_28]|nr:MAG: 50S ribosomal protein L21 [Deltaproteobacteria bacterium RIFCSPHIGHO2_02_FULL_40_28]OGQ20686.1 MAG: 50S ribosomal protein L21 [Deltaproteobacteria bacterium RIFCSPHIGHO2_12_FULL_40_32]OGQ38921.1 MAG: 50S ribosomal protein L21 [Deltaproteobacteria bacterium RIFCSPLOWO2_02_FULL_40_36]OGQ55281.1 MAG: 50S ribosomal protein L21 [Deltaproteobacteria bacterium RIFCSPLOWO2_12_FULL_40_28]
MTVVIETSGKQYQVSKGDEILVNKVEGNPGDAVIFDRVILVYGDKTSIGTPYIAGAKVVGKIVSQGRGKKIIVGKFKRRKGYHKKQGHRQYLTRVTIEDIQA